MLIRTGFVNMVLNRNKKMICEQLKESILKGDSIILDVRTTFEYDLNRIRDSINVPLQDLTKNADEFIGKDVYVYCQSGARSQGAVRFLNSLGANATNIGGISQHTECIEV